MQPSLSSVAALLMLIATIGCAHHRLGSDYSYQPPLAPAVYPQPIDNSQLAAPVVTTGVPVVGQTVVPPTMPPQVVMPQPMTGQPISGPVVAAGGMVIPCDPATMAVPVQTQPCPPPF